MRNIVVSGILSLGLSSGLIADESAPLKPINDGIEHSFKFGLLNLGYERVKTDCIYTGVETKIASILNFENDNKSKTLDHYINGEIRLGYNLGMSEVDVITPYGGIGFSVFSIEKAEGKLKNWNYASLGVKYMHKFGEMFEMGLHMKGSWSISQRQYQTFNSKPVKKEQPTLAVQEAPGDAPAVETVKFHNEDQGTKDNLTSVKVNDSRFITEIGVPMVWNLGEERKWSVHFEPYYMQIPNRKLTHVLGSKLALGYRY